MAVLAVLAVHTHAGSNSTKTDILKNMCTWIDQFYNIWKINQCANVRARTHYDSV